MAHDPDTFLLFVYGTLKRGGVRHHVLRGQRFLREARTRPKYLLFDFGTHPGMVVADGDGRAIHGELYEVERGLIPELDQIEGAPEEYRLAPVEVEGEAAAVAAYFCRLVTDSRALCEDDRWHNP